MVDDYERTIEDEKQRVIAYLESKRGRLEGMVNSMLRLLLSLGMVIFIMASFFVDTVLDGDTGLLFIVSAWLLVNLVPVAVSKGYGGIWYRKKIKVVERIYREDK